MARNKVSPIGVADGIDFSIEESPELKSATSKVPEQPSSGKTSPNRSYSKYYTPKPKLGKKGGQIGHPPIKEEERKIQFSVSCTAGQKERYKLAAIADGRKFPDFINHALLEYIENHKL